MAIVDNMTDDLLWGMYGDILLIRQHLAGIGGRFVAPGMLDVRSEGWINYKSALDADAICCRIERVLRQAGCGGKVATDRSEPNNTGA